MSDSREFRGRLLLKAIIVLVDAAALGLTGFIAIASVLQEKPEVLAIAALPAIGILVVLASLTNRTFSVIRIDGNGVAVSRLVGRTTVPWTSVETLYHWVLHQQSPHGGGAAEPFAQLRGPGGRRLLLLKSTFPPEMFECLLEFARGAGIRVELSRPS